MIFHAYHLNLLDNFSFLLYHCHALAQLWAQSPTWQVDNFDGGAKDEQGRYHQGISDS